MHTLVEPDNLAHQRIPAYWLDQGCKGEGLAPLIRLFCKIFRYLTVIFMQG